MWFWRPFLPPETLLEDEFDYLHFHRMLAVSWKCPVGVLALFSLFTLVGLRRLYLQEILETGNNYENILRPQGSSIILKMEKMVFFNWSVIPSVLPTRK